MKLIFGTLPDDHGFLRIMRPLTDWVFKFISWMIIGATLVFAWQKTGSPYIGALALVAVVLPGAFLLSFLNWLLDIDRGPKRTYQTKQRIRSFVVSIGFILWIAFTVATQVAMQQTVAAIVEFQKTMR
jgi:hypothetical protein